MWRAGAHNSFSLRVQFPRNVADQTHNQIESAANSVRSVRVPARKRGGITASKKGCAG